MCEADLKVCPRGPLAPQRIRALGRNFHALAEFHWGSWRKWLLLHPGKTWRDARLQEPVLPLAHMRFRLDWRWDGHEAVLQSRCTDETGYVQPTLAELVRVRGLDSYYFNNAIQSWKVAADGSVHNVHA